MIFDNSSIHCPYFKSHSSLLALGIYTDIRHNGAVSYLKIWNKLSHYRNFFSIYIFTASQAASSLSVSLIYIDSYSSLHFTKQLQSLANLGIFKGP